MLTVGAVSNRTDAGTRQAPLETAPTIMEENQT